MFDEISHVTLGFNMAAVPVRNDLKPDNLFHLTFCFKKEVQKYQLKV